MHDRPALPHVMFCIGGLARGGSETQLVTLLERLHGTRLEATVITLSQAADPRLLARLRRAGVEVVSVRGDTGPRPWQLASTVVRMATWVVRRRPDAIYAWLEEAALLAAPLARALRIPLLVARRNIFGSYAGRSGPVVRAIYLAERQARLVTVNSQAVADVTLARGVEQSRLRLVENGHAVQPAPPAPPDGEIVIGYVAGFRPEKGHFRLLDALSRVRTSTPWRVDLAGDGMLRPRIEAEARRRRLDGKLRFIGEVDDTRAFWADRHVALLLSDHEGSPNALIEAALAARPIVATAVGGVPDIVGEDGGRLVPPDDPDAIAAAIVELVDDRALQERAGEAARRQTAERFSVERSVERHWAVLAEVLGR
jgi:glycosyltransferase involved in cell wall biosynthesis